MNAPKEPTATLTYGHYNFSKKILFCLAIQIIPWYCSLHVTNPIYITLLLGGYSACLGILCAILALRIPGWVPNWMIKLLIEPDHIIDPKTSNPPQNNQPNQKA